MLEPNDESAITRRYMTLETVAAICDNAPMDRQQSPPCNSDQTMVGEQCYTTSGATIRIWSANGYSR
jgi:hypothetical protein